MDDASEDALVRRVPGSITVRRLCVGQGRWPQRASTSRVRVQLPGGQPGQWLWLRRRWQRPLSL